MTLFAIAADLMRKYCYAKKQKLRLMRDASHHTVRIQSLIVSLNIIFLLTNYDH